MIYLIVYYSVYGFYFPKRKYNFYFLLKLYNGIKGLFISILLIAVIVKVGTIKKETFYDLTVDATALTQLDSIIALATSAAPGSLNLNGTVISCS